MTARGGWTIHRLAAVDSTQQVAAELIAHGAAHRTAVVADRQTAGYGRKGDRWLDAPGDSLLMTLILRPEGHDARRDNGGGRQRSPLSRHAGEQASLPATTELVLFAMAAALAALDAIAETTAMHGSIKWPNDLLLGGKKVGGILGDATWAGWRLEALRIGIGINVRGARASFVARGLPDATSIAAETGHDLDRNTLLDALLRHFARHDDDLARGDEGAVVSRWRAAVGTIGATVLVTLMDGRTVRGTAMGVTDDGDLLIVDVTGESIRLSAPAVRSVRPLADERKADRSP